MKHIIPILLTAFAVPVFMPAQDFLGSLEEFGVSFGSLKINDEWHELDLSGELNLELDTGSLTATFTKVQFQFPEISFNEEVTIGFGETAQVSILIQSASYSLNDLTPVDLVAKTDGDFAFSSPWEFLKNYESIELSGSYSITFDGDTDSSPFSIDITAANRSKLTIDEFVLLNTSSYPTEVSLSNASVIHHLYHGDAIESIGLFTSTVGGHEFSYSLEEFRIQYSEGALHSIPEPKTIVLALSIIVFGLGSIRRRPYAQEPNK